jgi:hypothetical protein
MAFTSRLSRSSPFLKEVRSRSALCGAGLVVLLAAPLSVALVVLRRPKWYPVLDLAQTELRVRDVGSSHPPLIGLVGRLGTLGHQGSHPGPLSFWAMWPFYRLFGATAWALQTASVSLHLLAVGVILWIAHRRGGLRLMLCVAAVLAVLMRAYGTPTVTEAWNPYLPVLWWLVFLLAVWSIVCGDLPLLPVAVFAGSFCMQTHLPYVGLTIGLLGAAVAVCAVQAYEQRKHQTALREFVRWTLLAAALGIVLWLPPIIEQLTNSPGNLSVIQKEFTHPPEPPIGMRRGLELLLVHLNPWKLVAKETGATTGSLVPGLLLVAVWVAAVVVAWRLRHGLLLRLNAVLGVTLLLSAVSMSRIHGITWYYLMLWAWGTTALMLLAIGWTTTLVVAPRLGAASRGRVAAAGTVALAGVVVVSTALFTADATRARAPVPKLSFILGELLPSTVDALRHTPGGAGHARYVVTWSDPAYIGAQGFGLLNELDRRGLHVGALPPYRAAATTHRVLDPMKATEEVHLSVGTADIQTWRAKRGVRQVAYVDGRSPAERAEYERLRLLTIDELRAAGVPQLVPRIDDNLFVVLFDTRVPKATRDRVARMSALGVPTAVFVGPPLAS